ncbi:MAG: cyclic-di-AMP receptor [Clostridia bacterium]|nr:cyclic-di-AMP receptor [Clostridia bacterium]
MKLILAIVNNDDSACVSGELTRGGFSITKLSTTGGFLQTGNTTLLIGTEDDEVEKVKDIIRKHSVTRKKNSPTNSSFGRGLMPTDTSVETEVKGAAVFVLSVDNFEKL